MDTKSAAHPRFKTMKSFQFSKIVLLCFLLLLVGSRALPGYLTKNWPWASPPNSKNSKHLIAIRKSGLNLPGWQTVTQNVQQIGGHKWSVQQFQQNDEKQLILLLLPQSGSKAQPEVEWLDIKGFMQTRFKQWDSDSYRKLNFTVPSNSTEQSPVKVEASFFRAWNRQQTFAIVQWYAWSNGGNPAPSHWFFADQLAQLQQRRQPWIAVSLHIPIQPLGDITTVEQEAKSLAQTIQTTLMTKTLKY